MYDADTGDVLSKSKVPTNHDDLGTCVSGALRNVIDESHIPATQIDLVSVSTTLATNAIVEGAGRPAALVTVGFDDAALDRGGLRQVLGQDPVISLNGGHSSHGQEITDLDIGPLQRALRDIDHRVDAYAVVGTFSVRNPAHEQAVAEIIRVTTSKPVTCSHELSEQLNGPKRAVTALLNARLIALTHDLLVAVEASMTALGLTAPLMVVRGDGSLVSATFVRQRPIETILSGPAASVLGASVLGGVSDAVVADLGGTTTDVAVLAGGRPVFDVKGAVIGGHATMIDAIRVHTEGIGGDSHVRNTELGEQRLTIGPRRVVPLVVAAQDNDGVIQMLEEQSRNSTPRDTDGMYFWLRGGGSNWDARSKAEHQILEALSATPAGRPYQDVINSGLQRNAADRLLNTGVLVMAGFTPTDAMHVLALDLRYRPKPAMLGAQLLARSRNQFGESLGTDSTDICEQVYRRVAWKIAATILASAFDHDDLPIDQLEAPLAKEALSRSATQRAGVLSVQLGINKPLIAVGAPASIYFSEVARLLNTEVTVPQHSEVANALGAASAMIRLSTEITISAPRRGLFRVHAGVEPKTFYAFEGAQEFAERFASDDLATKMALAGATTFALSNSWRKNEVVVADRPLFLEAVLTVTASGRPSAITI